MERSFVGRIPRVGPIGAVFVTIAMPAIATLIALPFPGGDAAAASMYLLAVVFAAALGGVRAGLACSILSFLGLNYFFTPPLNTFRVSKGEDLVALVAFLMVAALVGAVVASALDDRARAERREREASLLNYFATKLLAAEPLDRRLQDLAAALAETFHLVRCEIRAEIGDREIEVAATHPGVDGEPVAVPVMVGDHPFGQLSGVRESGAGALSDGDRRLMDACAKQIAVAVQRARLDAEVEGARVSSEVSQMRAALFSSVTHDLRTPLASIKASVTTLLDEAVEHDPSQRRELLQAVLEETDRLNRLVGNILQLARVRAGALTPSKELTSLEDVVASVLHRLQPMLRHVRLRTIVRPDLPDLMIDPVQIDQVLTNILDNAVRHSPLGGEIQVSVAPWQESVRVRVTDQGPGIPPEDRRVVFEPFYRGTPGDGRSGSGLGLAIARAVVLAHGGRIWIEGAPAGGTAVVFELPVHDVAAVPQEPVG